MFKNAGTSVDAMLKANFGDRWATQEFETNDPSRNKMLVEQFLRDHPEISALSSHTALLPAPQLAERAVFPIIFVRHPLLRLASAYRFEVKQDADTFGARLAKRTDFPGYVEELLLQNEPGQARNFQAGRLAMNFPDSEGARFNRALRAVDALPFVGLVEAYDRSVDRLARMLEPHFPDFEPLIVQENVSGGAAHDVEGRLAEIRQQLGNDLFLRLSDANREDTAIFESVRERYRQPA
ncbi:MAG: hypothetical protein LC634_05865 [Sphingomonadales bacterium]|nr:hypothetical protein [Sphingomonadales bacterium]